MPGANRHFLRGQLWHITHRCHEKAFLLKFVLDAKRTKHSAPARPAKAARD